MEMEPICLAVAESVDDMQIVFPTKKRKGRKPIQDTFKKIKYDDHLSQNKWYFKKKKKHFFKNEDSQLHCDLILLPFEILFSIFNLVNSLHHMDIIRQSCIFFAGRTELGHVLDIYSQDIIDTSTSRQPLYGKKTKLIEEDSIRGHHSSFSNLLMWSTYGKAARIDYRLTFFDGKHTYGNLIVEDSEASTEPNTKWYKSKRFTFNSVNRTYGGYNQYSDVLYKCPDGSFISCLEKQKSDRWFDSDHSLPIIMLLNKEMETRGAFSPASCLPRVLPDSFSFSGIEMGGHLSMLSEQYDTLLDAWSEVYSSNTLSLCPDIDVSTFKRCIMKNLPPLSVFSVAVDENQELLVTGGCNGSICLYDFSQIRDKDLEYFGCTDSCEEPKKSDILLDNTFTHQYACTYSKSIRHVFFHKGRIIAQNCHFEVFILDYSDRKLTFNTKINFFNDHVRAYTIKPILQSMAVSSNYVFLRGGENSSDILRLTVSDLETMKNGCFITNTVDERMNKSKFICSTLFSLPVVYISETELKTNMTDHLDSISDTIKKLKKEGQTIVGRILCSDADDSEYDFDLDVILKSVEANGTIRVDYIEEVFDTEAILKIGVIKGGVFSAAENLFDLTVTSMQNSCLSNWCRNPGNWTQQFDTPSRIVTCMLPMDDDNLIVGVKSSACSVFHVNFSGTVPVLKGLVKHNVQYPRYMCADGKNIMVCTGGVCKHYSNLQNNLDRLYYTDGLTLSNPFLKDDVVRLEFNPQSSNSLSIVSRLNYDAMIITAKKFEGTRYFKSCPTRICVGDDGIVWAIKNQRILGLVDINFKCRQLSSHLYGQNNFIPSHKEIDRIEEFFGIYPSNSLSTKDYYCGLSETVRNRNITTLRGSKYIPFRPHVFSVVDRISLFDIVSVNWPMDYQYDITHAKSRPVRLKSTCLVIGFTESNELIVMGNEETCRACHFDTTNFLVSRCPFSHNSGLTLGCSATSFISIVPTTDIQLLAKNDLHNHLIKDDTIPNLEEYVRTHYVIMKKLSMDADLKLWQKWYADRLNISDKDVTASVSNGKIMISTFIS